MQQRVTALKTDRNMWTPEALLEAWHRSLQEKDRKAGTVDVGDPHPDCHHWLPQRAAACTTQIHQYDQSASECYADLVWLADRARISHSRSGGPCQTGWWRSLVLAKRAEKHAGQCPPPSGPALSRQRTQLRHCAGSAADRDSPKRVCSPHLRRYHLRRAESAWFSQLWSRERYGILLGEMVFVLIQRGWGLQ